MEKRGDLGGTESKWGGPYREGRWQEVKGPAPINNKAKLGLSYPSAVIKRNVITDSFGELKHTAQQGNMYYVILQIRVLYTLAKRHASMG